MNNLTVYKLPIIFVAIIVSMLLLAAIPSNKTGAPDKKTPSPAAVVEMTNTMKFTPDTVRIKKGQTVKWVNTSLLAHSVTADPEKSAIEGSVELPKGAPSFDSGMLDPEQTFQHTFNTTGTYQYFCIPHEGAKMYGWVIVTNK